MSVNRTAIGLLHYALKACTRQCGVGVGLGVKVWEGGWAPSLGPRFAFASSSLGLRFVFAVASPPRRCVCVAFASPSRRLQVAFASPSLRLRSAFASPSRAFASPSPSLRLRVAFAAPALRHRVAFASSSLTLRFAVAVSLSPSPCLSNDSRTSCCSVAGNTSKNTSAAHQRRVSGTSAAHQRLISGLFFTRICTGANRAASRFH